MNWWEGRWSFQLPNISSSSNVRINDSLTHTTCSLSTQISLPTVCSKIKTWTSWSDNYAGWKLIASLGVMKMHNVLIIEFVWPGFNLLHPDLTYDLPVLASCIPLLFIPHTIFLLPHMATSSLWQKDCSLFQLWTPAVSNLSFIEPYNSFLLRLKIIKSICVSVVFIHDWLHL